MSVYRFVSRWQIFVCLWNSAQVSVAKLGHKKGVSNYFQAIFMSINFEGYLGVQIGD